MAERGHCPSGALGLCLLRCREEWFPFPCHLLAIAPETGLAERAFQPRLLPVHPQSRGGQLRSHGEWTL